MIELAVKKELKQLVVDVLKHFKQAPQSMDSYRPPLVYFGAEGTNLLNQFRSFASAIDSLSGSSLIVSYYGKNRLPYLVAHFVYCLYIQPARIEFHEGLFDRAWERFWNDLNYPDWVYIGASPLQNFYSSLDRIMLDDNVMIVSRSLDALKKDDDWSERDISLINEYSQRFAGKCIFSKKQGEGGRGEVTAKHGSRER